MIHSKSIAYIFNWTQLLNWTIVSCLIVFYIFILNSPNWFTAAKIGFFIQFILTITLFILSRTKFLLKWILFDTIAVPIIVLMELGNNGTIRTASGEDAIQVGFLTIILLNLMFGFSIAFIIKYFAKKR